MNRSYRLFIVGLLFFIVVTLVILYQTTQDHKNEMSEREKQGRLEEYQQLSEIQNTQSCEEMILLVTQYTHSFWNGTVNDQMIQEYKDRCVPKQVNNGSES